MSFWTFCIESHTDLRESYPFVFNSTLSLAPIRLWRVHWWFDIGILPSMALFGSPSWSSLYSPSIYSVSNGSARSSRFIVLKRAWGFTAEWVLGFGFHLSRSSLWVSVVAPFFQLHHHQACLWDWCGDNSRSHPVRTHYRSRRCPRWTAYRFQILEAWRSFQTVGIVETTCLKCPDDHLSWMRRYKKTGSLGSFLGFVNALVLALFAYIGTELIGAWWQGRYVSRDWWQS